VVKDVPLNDGPYKFFPSGGGGLLSTANDYMRFCQMLLNNGELDGKRILGRKTVDLIRTNHLPDSLHVWGNKNIGFGLGFSVAMNGVFTPGLGSKDTYAWGGLASTIFWIDPQEELIGILMTQLFGDSEPFQNQFRVLTNSSIID